jgi:predicted NAD/FAD-dependent oxidoreductase
VRAESARPDEDGRDGIGGGRLECRGRSLSRRLYFAGDYSEGGLIEGAAQSGYKAAQRAMAG